VRLGGSGKEVEEDETFIDGAARFMHADKRREKITDRGVKGKAAVMGILERSGNVRSNLIPTRCKNHLQAEIRAHVKAHGAINTDALLSHQGLNHQDSTKQLTMPNASLMGKSTRTAWKISGSCSSMGSRAPT
jgi:hypothetical protein